MANKEPTTVAPEVAFDGNVSNPLDIKWPFDPHGFTSMLRKEGVRAVGRISGNDAKLEVFTQTLRALAQHASVKIETQKREAEIAAAAAQNIIEAEYARSLADQKREAERLRAMADAAEAAVKAKEAMPE